MICNCRGTWSGGCCCTEVAEIAICLVGCRYGCCVCRCYRVVASPCRCLYTCGGCCRSPAPGFGPYIYHCLDPGLYLFLSPGLLCCGCFCDDWSCCFPCFCRRHGAAASGTENETALVCFVVNSCVVHRCCFATLQEARQMVLSEVRGKTMPGSLVVSVVSGALLASFLLSVVAGAEAEAAAGVGTRIGRVFLVPVLYSSRFHSCSPSSLCVPRVYWV